MTGLVLLESISEYNHAESTCLSLDIVVQSSDIILGSLDSYCGQNNWQPTFKNYLGKKEGTINSGKKGQTSSGIQAIFANV